MPSPTSGFFGGLAQGIFGRLREHEDEQRKADVQQKQQTLSYLTSLIDQATPETRPILFEQIAQTMNLKGKNRGVWDMLTGKGRQDYSDALGQMFNQTIGKVTGPEQYHKLKNTKVFEGMSGAAPGGFPIPTGRVEDRSKGLIALRDPQAEELAELEAKYDLMGKQKYRDIETREAASLEKQSILKRLQSDLDMAKATHSATLKAEGEARALAVTLAGGPGMPITEDIWDKATNMIEQKYNLQLDNLRAGVGLKKAKTAEAEAAAAINPATGMPIGKPMTQAQEAGLSKGLTQDAIAQYGKFKEERANFVALDEKFRSGLTNLQNQLSRYQLYYKDGAILQAGTNAAPSYVPERLKKEAEKVTNLYADSQRAKKLAEDTLGAMTNTYGDFFDVKDFYNVTPRPAYRPPSVTSIGSSIPPFPPGAAGPSPATTKKAPSVDIGEEMYILLETVPDTSTPLQKWGQTYQVIGNEGKQGKYNKIRVKRIQ